MVIQYRAKIENRSNTIQVEPTYSDLPPKFRSSPLRGSPAAYALSLSEKDVSKVRSAKIPWELYLERLQGQACMLNPLAIILSRRQGKKAQP